MVDDAMGRANVDIRVDVGIVNEFMGGWVFE